jgi:hypothetical protein
LKNWKRGGNPLEIIKMAINSNDNSKKIIILKQSDRLKQKGLVTKSIYYIDTNNVKISLNHSANADLIFTIDRKKWQNNLNTIVEMAEENGIIDNESKRLLKSHLNDNHDEILLNDDSDYNTDQEKNEDTAEQKGNPMANTANLLLKLFQQTTMPVLFKDQFKVPHVLINIYDHYEILPIEDTKFRRYLSKFFYDNFNEVPNAEAVRNVVQLLAAKSIFEGDTITLHLRTAWSNSYTQEAIYYDLSDEKNRCVRIASDSWKILENQTDTLFRRYNHQVPQIEPLDNLDDQDNVLDQFITLLNIKNYDDRLLLKCYIVSLFIPEIAQVILILLGEQGGAKSTLQELVKMLVDPSITKTFTFPRDTSEFIQQLSHNYLVYYDNISVIQDWISDLLCRAVTGSSFSKRALYTNDDDVYYSFMRKLGINGIDLAKINADLSDRSINIKPDRIDKLDRVKLDKIWKEFNTLKPRLLGYIFDILSKVLKYKKNNGEIKFPNGLNRMADWEEYAEIISRCMGKPDGELQRVYQENISKQVDDAVASSQLCIAVLELIENEENTPNEWRERTPTDLYDKLSDIARYTLKLNNLTNRKYWPQSPGSLSYNLNRVKTILREKGIEVITGVKNKDGVRVIKLTKLDSSSSSFSIPRTSFTSSTSSKEDNSSTKEEKNLDDPITNNGETTSKTSFKENSQKQAQNSDSGRFDDQDDLFPPNESIEEKYRREQEEISKWNKGK